MTLTTSFQKIGTGGTQYFNQVTGYLELWAKYESQSTSGNKSKGVTVELRLVVSGGYIGNYQSTPWTISGSLSNSGDIGSGSHRSQTLGSASGDITHNSDGTKSVSFSGTFNATAWGKTLTVSGSADLPKINRKATISTASDFNDEQDPTITYSNPAGNSVSSLQACISLTNAVDDVPYRNISKTDSSYTFELTTEERNTLINATTTANNRTVFFVVKTVIGSDTFYSYVQKTFSIINANPVFSDFDFEDTNSTTVALTGSNQKVIKGYSNVEATISTTNIAEALKSATMVKYRFNCLDKSVDILYSSSASVDGTINGVGSGTFNVYAIDSRNNSTLVIKNASEIIDYNSLTKGNIGIARSNGVSEQTTLQFNGTIDLVNFGLVTNSITECKYRYKTGSNNWSAYTNITPTVSSGQFSFNALIQGDTNTGFNIENTYDIEVYVADELSNVTFTTILNSGIPNMAFHKDGIGIMGKYDTTVGGKGQVAGNPLAYYPVGSLYLSISSTSPATLFGGTWQQITGDAYLKIVTSNAGSLDGTSSQHKIPLTSIPSHNHTLNYKISSTQYLSGEFGAYFVAGSNNSAIASAGGGQAYYPYYYGIYVWVRTA